MLKSKNCIRTGQVLLDENLHTFLLCNSCHMDFRSYSVYCKHLEECEGVERIFHDNLLLKYNTKNCEQIKRITGKIIKQYFIYNIADVELLQRQSSQSKVSTQASSQALQRSATSKYLNVMKIEEELLNPCWYTNDDNDDIRGNKLNSSHVTASKKNIQYDKLVEAVTPFVQFKENAKSLHNNTNNNSAKNNNNLLKTIKTNNTADNITTTDRSIDVLPTRDKSKLMNKRRLYITLNSNENTQANSNHSKDPMITANCTKTQNNKSITVATSSVRYFKRQKQSQSQPQEQQQQQQKPQAIQPSYQVYSTETPQPKRPRLIDATALSLKPANNAITATPKKITSQTVNTVNKSANRLLNPMVINLNTPSSSTSSSSSSSLLSLSSSSTAAILLPNNVKPATVNTDPTITDRTAIIPNTKEKQTAQILNKLQTLGLQIKRTKPVALLTPAGPQFSGKTDRKTLEFLNKLQSKGTKVTILKSSSNSKSNSNQLHPISIPPAQISNHKTNSLPKLGNVMMTTTATPTTTSTTTPTTTTRGNLALTTRSCETKCKLPLSKNIIVKKIK